MTKTVLQMVQIILNDMDSEPVNQLSDTLEAEQVASVLAETFNDIVTTREIPEHRQLLKLTPASDSEYPTEFIYEDNVTRITNVWYDTQLNNVPLDSARTYKEIYWCEPLDFLRKIDSASTSGTAFKTVLERSSGTTLRIANNAFPSYYTSFDNKRIIMDAFHDTYDDTLQASKVRAYGVIHPIFNQFDPDHVVDLDPAYTQYLLKEATARCFDLFKGGVTPKLEQSIKRVKNHLRNDRYRTVRPNTRNDYGR